MSDSWQDVADDSRQLNSDEDVEEEFRDPNLEFIDGIREVEAMGLVDIGALGAWSVSSSKSAAGIKELREDSPLTYWQSDGIQPHHLDIHFSKKVSISRISLFTDYLLDESYTPSKILILAGNGFHDLIEVTTLNLNQPSGWTHVVFDDIEGLEEGLKTFLVRFLIISNHQHGKDAHLRSVKIYSRPVTYSIDSSVLGSFQSRKLISESTIR